MDPNDPILTRIVIRRNQSLNGRGLFRVLVLGAIPPLTFMAFAVVGGWWPILGFCAGAFVVFAGVLYMLVVAVREREVVTITARHVLIESGRGRPRMRVSLDRYWTRIERREGPPAALAIVSRGVEVEIAAALAEPQRKTLAQRLAALVGPNAREPDAAMPWCHDRMQTERSA